MRILGLDPSLSSTGWGIIEVENNRVRYVADGFIKTEPKTDLTERLYMIYKTLCDVIEFYKPDEAAIEQVFLTEYEPNQIKKAVVGVGHAEKGQVETMVKILLPGCKPKNNDSSDALAAAICHNSFHGAHSIRGFK